MSGPDHSKKAKNVTIDLNKDDVRVVAPAPEEPVIIGETNADASAAPDDAVVHTKAAAPETKPAVKPGVAQVSAAVPPSGNGVAGKLGAGFLGGLIALAGAAGLQYSGQLPNFGNGAELAALQMKIDELSVKPAFDPSALQAALDATNGEVLGLKDQIAKMPAGNTDSIEGLQPLVDRLTALETAIAGMQAGSGSDPATSSTLKTLTDRLAALEVAQPNASDASAVALAIAASGLKAAIDRGGPFPAELETYASVAPDSPDIGALRLLAGSGVPSQSDLIAGFNTAANAMIAAGTVTDPEASLLQRLTDSASNLVKARRVGDIAGDEPDALIARMEVALNRGDLDSVLAEATKLPEASKAAGKAWLDLVTARRDAASLVTRALGQALTAAGGKS